MSRHSVRPLLGILLIVTLTLTACMDDGRDASDANVVVRDSAGIRIVDNMSPSWSEREVWTIDPEPVLQIGTVDGDDAYQFANVWGASRRQDGTIAVSEHSANEVRLFASDGAHIRTIGRAGEGPGEFSQGPFVIWAHPDTLLAWDPRLRRLTWLSDRGDVQRTVFLGERVAEAATQFMSSPAAWRLTRDGSLLLHGYLVEVSGGEARTRPTLRLLAAQGTVSSLGDYAAGEQVVVQNMAVTHRFTPYPYSAVRDEPFAAFVSRTEWREITGFDADGNVKSLLRIHAPRIPITDDVIEGEQDMWRGRAERSRLPPSVYLDAYSRLSIPDSFPAIRDLHVDVAGNLWVGRRETAEFRYSDTFDVLDLEGRWLGTVHVPGDPSPIYEIGDDYILTGWRDDLDVPHVRMYRIVKR